MRLLSRLSLSCLLIVGLLALTACTTKYQNSLNFDPSEPLRVVILPFAQVNEKGEFIEPDASLGIDKVALVSSRLKEQPDVLLRKLVQAQLNRSGLDVFPPALVDSELSHHGFAKSDLSFQHEKIFKANPRELCSHLVSCDAILYGKVTKWDRSYYGIETVSTIGLDLKLVSVRDGKVLFSSNGEDSDSRGLTKGPTGLSNLVIEPVRGLDNDIITALARKLVVRMLQPLRIKERPGYLNSSPPAIYAAAHDAKNGKFDPQQGLNVVVFGSPKLHASFSIGDVAQNIPLVEQSESHYSGVFYPLPSDKIKDLPVRVQLSDNFGRKSSLLVKNGPVSLN